MIAPLSSVLLIDDMKSDNFLTTRIIRRAQIAGAVEICLSGGEGLTLLREKIAAGTPVPDLLLLDINMPGMNGWEFLHQYDELPAAVRKNIVVCMLTTSDAEEDRALAGKYPTVRRFCTKPFTDAQLAEILEDYFPGALDQAGER